MLGLPSMIFTIALLVLADGSRSADGRHQQTPSAELPRVPAMQKKVTPSKALVVHAMFPKLSKLAVTRNSFRQNAVPEVKHKKKPGQGYVKGSPLYEKQNSHKAAETLLPAPPTGRQRPSVVVIIFCVLLGVFVLVLAACINKEFLVRKHYDGGQLPDVPTFKTDMSYKDPPPSYKDPPMQQLQPMRAQVEYVEPGRAQSLGATLPPPIQQQTVPPSSRFGEPPVSMMPSQQKQYPSMQQLGPPAGAPMYSSMPVSANSPPGSLGNLPMANVQPASGPQSQRNYVQQQQPLPVYGTPPGSMPPPQTGGPSYLPPPRSQQYQSMPPVGSN